jgi:hypothetical protein
LPLKKIKQACLEYGKGDVTGGNGAVLPLQLDAVNQARMAPQDLDALGTHFNDPTFTLLAKHYPEYQKRRSASYH